MTARFMMSSSGKPKPLTFDPQADTRPILASAASSWAGIPFEVHELPPVDEAWETGPLAGERGLMITIEGRRASLLRVCGQERSALLTPGLVTFSDGEQPLSWLRATGHGRAVVFHLTPVWNARLVAEGGPTSFANLPPIPPHETARALALAVCSEVASGAGSGALFAESASVALLSYALQRMPARAMRVRGSLSDGQRRRISRFIDEHLSENISLSQLSAMTGLQARHFTTLFRAAFGVTPHRYLIQRRLAAGARLLLETQQDVGEIALHVGFSSQSHFASAFRKHFGVSPRRYAQARTTRVALS